MGKMKELTIEDTIRHPDFETMCVDTAKKINYSRLYKAILLRLLSNSAIVGDETPTAAEYIESAAELTRQAVKHLESL